MTIKAIETVYNGYKFRSRLEARWAVFFDAMGIEYEYEPQGFDLGELGWYLPDFWLPQVGMWAEVKGAPFTDEERQKCEAIALGAECSVLMLDGPPAARNYWAFVPDWCYEETGPGFEDYRRTKIEGVSLCDYQIDRAYLHESRFYASTGAGDWEIANPYNHPISCVCGYCDQFGAIRAARQARFEHGEQPVTAAMLKEAR